MNYPSNLNDILKLPAFYTVDVAFNYGYLDALQEDWQVLALPDSSIQYGLDEIEATRTFTKLACYAGVNMMRLVSQNKDFDQTLCTFNAILHQVDVTVIETKLSQLSEVSKESVLQSLVPVIGINSPGHNVSKSRLGLKRMDDMVKDAQGACRHEQIGSSDFAIAMRTNNDQPEVFRKMCQQQQAYIQYMDKLKDKVDTTSDWEESRIMTRTVPFFADSSNITRS